MTQSDNYEETTMKIDTFYDGVSLFRRDKILYGQFHVPHLVISTCRAAGGVQWDIDYVLNHQSCEPKDHHRDMNYRDATGYRQSICTQVDLPPEKCVTMGTAANMHHAAIVKEKFRDLEVIAVVTGGVETNAGRAGDPASVLEKEDGFESLKDQEKTEIKPGTINTMLFISQPLTEAAITRAIMTATEAKGAALQELAINSRYSDGLATGTGTDQIIISAPNPPTDQYRLTWAGKHSKLGELIGTTVKEAVKQTLACQNGITPAGQCSAKIHLERFGCSKESMLDGICTHLQEEQAELLGNNFHAVNRDPIVVAGVATLAHLHDKFAWGILPPTCRMEIMGAAAAQLACSVGDNYARMDIYRNQLGELLQDLDNRTFLKLCYHALALGFSDKWES